MTIVNNDLNNPYDTLGLGRQAPEQTDGNNLGQADFLALLTTQLSNQDPLEPMDNTAFVSQMAEFSSLSSLQELNDSFGSLASSMTSNQALQASGLVGRQVMIPTSNAYLSADGDIEGRVNLEQTTQDIHIDIVDESGQLVRRMNQGAYSQGELDFKWDGLNENGERMPEGMYRINVFGKVDGQTEQIGTMINAQVSSVNLGQSNGQIMLNLLGLGQVQLSDVQEIGQ